MRFNIILLILQILFLYKWAVWWTLVFGLIFMSGLNQKLDLLDDAMVTTLYLGLIDILFGYAYTVRTTEGEDNVSHSC